MVPPGSPSYLIMEAFGWFFRSSGGCVSLRFVNSIPLFKGSASGRRASSIMVMHSFASLLGGIMNTRLQSVQTRHGPEPQNGFTAYRGHQDSLYSQETAIRKRLEHGLDTWAAYIDWVAGFDTVDHSVLWPVLEK
mgnify:CR=1 FL=1